MLYDLNVPWSSNQNSQELQRTISFLSELGYDTLALNHVHSGPLPSQISNAIPSTQPFTLPPKTTLLRRCTLTLIDPAQNYRLPVLASTYDILALRPTNEKAYLAACISLSEHSLISLDLTQRFPFHWKPKPLMTAINRGIRIEICYGQATGEESNARRNFISNTLAIVRATKGRGLVISSEAKSVLGVRAPADVLNLLGVWGLARERGLQSMGVNPRGVVINEGVKRSSFRGVIDIIDGGESEIVKSTPKEDAAGKKGKRKPEETNAGPPAISKRAAKRAKLLMQSNAASGVSFESPFSYLTIPKA
ncbi:related to ribonuclease P protein subunit p30 [Rhynchosporium graminicola]|uniref:Related to ribonuclease P protein subunit p30 n=1 Tax=Rhynchosporium graminicola TaxID=2792576 RepID=A0A1E1L1R3_9HELO|nr:related to ribonuclease P protein subunit p30 [Rhynchosporium commune]